LREHLTVGRALIAFGFGPCGDDSVILLKIRLRCVIPLVLLLVAPDASGFG